MVLYARVVCDALTLKKSGPYELHPIRGRKKMTTIEREGKV